MAQTWVCEDCGYLTTVGKDAGDHERKYNHGNLCGPGATEHYMEDVGE